MIFKNILYLLVWMLVINLGACRKQDEKIILESNLSQDENKFFNSNRSNELAERSLVNYLIRINNSSHFVEKTIARIGYPHWNKILEIPNIQRGGRGNSDSSETTYFIPFVRDSQNYVNASMVLKIQGADTSFSYKCDWQYHGLQNDNSSNTDTAEHYAIFFMTLDNKVFGRTKFDIVDTNLFRNGNSIAKSVSLDIGQSKFGRENVLAPMEVCSDTYVSYASCSTPSASQCIPNCDECIVCTAVAVLTYCWIEYVDDGSGGNGDPPVEGGGGSGGGSTPPECPPSSRMEDITDPCEPGWQPPVWYGSDPCDKVAPFKQDQAFKTAYADLRTKLGASSEFYYRYQTNGTMVGPTQGPVNNCEMDTKTLHWEPMQSYLHSHYSGCPEPIFSPGDLKFIYDVYSTNKATGNFVFTVATTQGNYVLVIDNLVQFDKFGENYFLEDSPYEMEDLEKLFRTFRISKDKQFWENEELFLQFLKRRKSGFALLKANEDFTQYTLLSLDSENKRKETVCP